MSYTVVYDQQEIRWHNMNAVNALARHCRIGKVTPIKIAADPWSVKGWIWRDILGVIQRPSPRQLEWAKRRAKELGLP